MNYINNVEFAQQNQSLSNIINVDTLIRAKELYPELSGKIEYTVSGSRDKKNKPLLIVRIYGKISTLCQNCLEKLDVPIDYSNNVPIFYKESDMDDALSNNDMGYTDGILAEAEFSIGHFIEDEFIMLMPIAPKHSTCKAMEYNDKPDNPFSVLVK